MFGKRTAIADILPVQKRGETNFELLLVSDQPTTRIMQKREFHEQ